jgi:fucose permease
VLGCFFYKTPRPTPAPAPDAQRDLDRGSRRRALTVALTAALYVAAELAISTRLVQHLVRDRGATDERAAAHLALFFALMLVGRATGAFLTVPLSNRSYLVLSALASATLAALGLLVHPALLCVSALALAPFFPTLMDLVAQEFPAEFARVTSLLLFIVSATVMLTHELIGLISDASSLRVALGLAPLYLVVAALLVPASRARAV